MSNNRNCVPPAVRHPILHADIFIEQFFTKGKPPFELIFSELSIKLNIDNLVGEWNYSI
ncbi:MAG: hypothetical protein WCS73_11575 [Lentisphaeria bacterium]